MPWAPVIDNFPNSLNPANNLSLSDAASSFSSAAVSAADAPIFPTAPAAINAPPASADTPIVNGDITTKNAPTPIAKSLSALTTPVIELVNCVTPLAPTDIPLSPLTKDLPIVSAAFAAPSNTEPSNFAAPAANSSPTLAPIPPPASLIRLSFPSSNAPPNVENFSFISPIDCPGFASICTVFANLSFSSCSFRWVVAPSAIAFC